MAIYIMRHGQTVWNRLGTIQGRSKNRLSQEGKQLTEIQAKRYQDVKFDLIISSPLVRAIQTANIMNQYHKVKIVKDARINEVDQGIYTGRNKKTMSDEDWKNYKSRSKEFGMEKFDEIVLRIKDFANYLKANFKNKNILVISHRTTAKILYFELKNIAYTNESVFNSELFDNAEINLVEI